MSHTVCPSVNVLEDLLRGNLVDPHLHDLADHLEGCSDCQARAKTLVPNDTLVEALRASPAADSIANEMPRNLVEQIKQLPQNNIMATSDATFLTSDTKANGGDADLNFLEPAQQADEIGRLGGYGIVKVLGKGGMGVVFLADDPKLERRVAMKVMLPKIAANPTAKDRFLREARAAAKLKSDHIVTIYQVDEANGIPFLAMELLDGRPLDELISKGRSLSVPQILRIGQEVAKGLDAAHEKGLIHRDIKPANLWLESSGRIKILDFGLARSEKDDVHLTQTGAIVGTPAFMAPEQAQGDKGVDARADLFSLGCVLYRLCAGEIPFKGDTTMGTLLALAMDTPTAPSAINTAIPQALSELIMQLLEKQPAKRPASAKEVLERLSAMERTLTPASNAPDLTAVLSSTQSSSTPGFSQFNASAIKPQKSKPGSKRWIALACAMLLIGGGAFAVYQLVFDTPNGRIVVQIEGEDVDARFKKGKLELYDKDGKLIYTLEPSQRDKELPAGKYTIKVVGADGLTLDTDKFEMKRGDKVVVRVVLDPTTVASNTGPKVSPKVEPRHLNPSISSLDKLDSKLIPEAERFPWQPKELVAVLGEQRGRHWGRIHNLSFSADGKTIVSVGDYCGQIFDAATLQHRTFLPSHVTSAVYSADRKTLIIAVHTTVVTESGVWLWDVTGPEPKRGLRLMEKGPTEIVLSADGKRLAADTIVSDKTIHLWDLGGEKPRELPGIKDLKSVTAMAISFDGNSLLTGHEKGMKPSLWDLTDAEPKQRAMLDIHEGNIGAIESVAFSPDGKSAATGAWYGPTLLWDIGGPKPSRRAVINTNGRNLVFSPDGRTLALRTDVFSAISVVLFDLAGAEPSELARIRLNCQSLAFSPDGKTLATGSEEGQVRLWDITGKEPKERVPFQGHIGPLTGAVLAPDGKTLATYSSRDSVIRLWDVSGTAARHRAELRGHTSTVSGICFSPDSKTLASSSPDNTVRLWDLTKMEPEERLRLRPPSSVQLRAIAFAPDGKSVAFSDGDMVVRLWDVTGEEPKERAVLPKSGGPLVFSSDGKTLICSMHQKTPHLWDLSGTEPRDLGQIEYKSPYSLSNPHGLNSTPMALFPDGKTLAVAAKRDGIAGAGLLLWDLSTPTPKEGRFLPLMLGGIWTVAVSPDGKTVAAATTNGDLLCWDTSKTPSLPILEKDVVERWAKQATLKSWKFPGPINAVSFAPDSKHLITANANGTAYVLRLPSP